MEDKNVPYKRVKKGLDGQTLSNQIGNWKDVFNSNLDVSSAEVAYNELLGRGANPTWFDADATGTIDATSAFNNALVLSKVLLIPQGSTFLIGNVDLTGVTVVGTGTIKKKSSAECAFHVKGDGTVINGVKFIGESTSSQPNTDIKLGEGCKNVRIQNCTFGTNTYSAIAAAVDTGVSGVPYTTKVRGVVISNNVFTGYARPLHLHSVGNITINHNIFQDTGYDAIRLRENDGFALIDGNQFINIGMRDVTFDGGGNPIWIDDQTRDAIDTHWSGQNLTIVNNIVNVTAMIGFDVKSTSTDRLSSSSKVIIANNQLYKTRYSAILIAGDNDIDEDTVTGEVGDWGVIDGFIISQNIIQECNQNNKSNTGSLADAGISIKQLVKYVSVSENYLIANFGHGVFVYNDKTKVSLDGSDSAVTRSGRVVGNLCVNNGHPSNLGGTGVSVQGCPYFIIEQNICENDSGMTNAGAQAIGILLRPDYNGFLVNRSMIIRDNICRNNTQYQIKPDPNNQRIDAFAVFSGNIEEGTNAYWRGTWQQSRRILFGVTIPTASEGTFQQGDIIYNTGVTSGGKVGWVCVTGGNPGTWKAFGVVDA